MSLRLQRILLNTRVSPVRVAVTLFVYAEAGLFVGYFAAELLEWQPAIGLLVGGLAGIAAFSWRLSRAAPTALPLSFLQGVKPYESDCLRLRLTSAGDAGAILATIDAAVVGSMGWTAAHARSWPLVVRHPLVALESGMPAICAKDSDRLVGAVAFAGLDSDLMTAELGCWLGPNDRGRGLGAAAIALAAEVAWSRGLRCFRLGTDATNEAMRRSIEKAGGSFVEQLPHVLPNGNATESCWYVLSRS